MVAATPPTAATLKKSLRDVSVKRTSASDEPPPNTHFYAFVRDLVKKHSRNSSVISTRIHTNVIFTPATQSTPRDVVEFPGVRTSALDVPAVMKVTYDLD